jgi:predicted aldo/keto reductase-like oxidoreductase
MGAGDERVDRQRRRFLQMSAAALALAACGGKRSSAAEAPVAEPVPRRALGATGVTVSAIGIGGYHLGKAASDEEAVRIVRTALDRGVDFLDNSWDYNGGKSEERMGRALADGYRKKAFLMTKLDGRTKAAAAAQLEQSLRRLRTEVIDLVQIHEVIRPDDPDRCFADGGCIEALIDARNAGKLRFIGFTGHKDPSIHRAMLQASDDHGFRFDTVQMPLNVMDVHYRSFEKLVLPILVERKIGVLGMKSLGDGTILESRVVTPIECLHYAMSLPTSVVITGCETMATLDQAIVAATTFRGLTPSETFALLDKTRILADSGRYEPFKTSGKHDSTAEHPEWLEGASM